MDREDRPESAVWDPAGILSVTGLLTLTGCTGGKPHEWAALGLLWTAPVYLLSTLVVSSITRSRRDQAGIDIRKPRYRWAIVFLVITVLYFVAMESFQSTRGYFVGSGSGQTFQLREIPLFFGLNILMALILVGPSVALFSFFLGHGLSEDHLRHIPLGLTAAYFVSLSLVYVLDRWAPQASPLTLLLIVFCSLWTWIGVPVLLLAALAGFFFAQGRESEKPDGNGVDTARISRGHPS